MSTAASSPPSSLVLDPDEQRVIEESRARRLQRLARRELWSLVAFTAAFVACATALALYLPSQRAPGVPTVLILIAAYATAFRLDFEIASGTAVPTELILVPMLFLLPSGSVPLAVAGGILLASSVECLRGELHLERLVLRVLNASYAIGPALVLGLAGESGPDLARWPLYLAALAAQFALDFVVTAARQWITLGVPPRLHLRAMTSVYVIDAGLAPVGLAVAFASTSSPAGVLLAMPLIALLGVFARERRVRIDHELELRDAYRGTAFLLGDVVEADDSYTGLHSREVVELTLRVGDVLGLSPRERRDAEIAALLHDVGKVRVPKSIVNKPGPLTPEERAVMERHTIEGERLLLRVGGLLGEIGRVVRSCHERYDGRGYPDGLSGDEIPLLARIVACCDAFDAMTSDRSYRKAMPVAEAIAELRRASGTQFDPVVVEALVDSLPGYAGSIAEPPKIELSTT
ncbi:MAG TPA: HD-GYP domain-containing protein [Gaiellaceae bacterium]|nr:HD-GYP domain-containing protein [Gaiellaceae bacterium]